MWQSSCLSSQGVGLQVWATMLGEAIFKELNHCTMMQAPLDSTENQNDVTSTKNKIKIKMLPNIPRNQERRRKPKFPNRPISIISWMTRPAYENSDLKWPALTQVSPTVPLTVLTRYGSNFETSSPSLFDSVPSTFFYLFLQSFCSIQQKDYSLL